jgi:hypothetical protein
VIVTTDKDEIYPGSETTCENKVLTGMFWVEILGTGELRVKWVPFFHKTSLR